MKTVLCFFILLFNFIHYIAATDVHVLNETVKDYDYANQKVYQISSIPHFESWIKQQQQLSLTYLLRNFNPPGTKVGFVAASPSTEHPNYFYTWIRDSSLVSSVLVSQYYNKTGELENILLDFVNFQLYTQKTIADAPCRCLGEPKYNPDGSPFKGEWGRPQFDQQGTRAMTMIQIANSYQSQRNDLDYIRTKLVPAIYLDLDSIVNIWMVPCFDLWEEIKGVHFYTLMVMRNGLLDGSDFAKQHHDIKRTHLYRRTAREIEDRLNSFWSPRDKYIKVTQNQIKGRSKPSGLDVSVILAANLAANRYDGFFTPGSDKVLSTASILEDTFANLYPLNKQNTGNNKKYGISIGRYPEDIYDGYSTTLGNPWFLATAAMTEVYYLAMKEWKKQKHVEVNWINYEFFKKRDPSVEIGHVYELGHPDFENILERLSLDADKFLATIQYHVQANGALSEQFNRDTGFQQGAMNLSWSYSSFLSAINARSQFLNA